MLEGNWTSKQGIAGLEMGEKKEENAWTYKARERIKAWLAVH